MELSPEEKTIYYDKLGFPTPKSEDLAINYLIDSEAEYQRLLRW